MAAALALALLAAGLVSGGRVFALGGAWDPTLTVDPASAQAGDVIRVQGSGFATDDTVQLWHQVSFGSQTLSTLMQSVTTDPGGGFTADVPVRLWFGDACPGSPDEVVAEAVYAKRQLGTDLVDLAAAPVRVRPWLNRFYEAVHPGDTITLAGCLFAANPSFTVRMDGEDVAITGSAVVNNVTRLTVTVPGADRFPAGRTVTFAVYDGVYAPSVKVFVSVATLTASPGTASPGSAVRLSGARFGAGEAVSLWYGPADDFGSRAQTLGEVTAGADGTFTFDWTIPADLAAGNYLVKAYGSPNDAATTVAVSGGGGGSPPPSGGGGGGSSAPPPPVRGLRFLQQPPAVLEPGRSFSVSVEVSQDGARLTSSIPVGLTLVAPGGATASLAGATIVNAADGVATFTGLSVDGTLADGYRLRATDLDSPGNTAWSEAFRLAGPHLVQGELAEDGAGGYRLAVELRGADGGRLAGRSDRLRVRLAAVQGGGMVTGLEGTTEVRLQDGVAVFEGLALDGEPGSVATVVVEDLDDGRVPPLMIAGLRVADREAAALEIAEQPAEDIREGEAVTVRVRLVDARGRPIRQPRPGMRLRAELITPAGQAHAAGARLDDTPRPWMMGLDVLEVQIRGGVGRGFRLRLSDAARPQLAPVRTRPFTVRGPTRLVFTRPPVPGARPPVLLPGRPLVPQGEAIGVQVLDQDGRVWAEPLDITLEWRLLRDGRLMDGSWAGFEVNQDGDATAARSRDGAAVFAGPIGVADGSVALRDVVLTARPSLSWEFDPRSPYGWVTPAVSEPFSVAESLRLFRQETPRDEGDAPGRAVWPQALPAPGRGKATGFKPPYAFAAVEWTVPDHRPGEPLLLSGDPAGTKGFCVTGGWTLEVSGELSTGERLRGALSGSGCREAAVDVGAPAKAGAGVRAEGGLVGLDRLPAGHYGFRLTLRSPEQSIIYGAEDVYLLAAAVRQARERPLANIRKPMELVADPEPIRTGASGEVAVRLASVAEPVHALGIHFYFPGDALEVTAVTPPAGWWLVPPFFINPRNTIIQMWPDFTADRPNQGPPPLEEGDTVFTLGVRCLRPGTWPISFRGNGGGLSADENALEVMRAVSSTIAVTCLPAEERGAPGASVDPRSGRLRVTLSGSDLEGAVGAELTDADGRTVATADGAALQWSEGLLTATFDRMPAGFYGLTVRNARGEALRSLPSTGPSALAAPPAVSLFRLFRADDLPQLPGKPVTHLWRLENWGTVDAVAVVLFSVPGFMKDGPLLNRSVAPPGTRSLGYGRIGATWMEYVAVPVEAGGAAYIPMTMTLPSAAVFSGAPAIRVGDILPVAAAVQGALTPAEAEALAGADDETFGVQASEGWKAALQHSLSGLRDMDPRTRLDYRNKVLQESARWDLYVYTDWLLFQRGGLDDFIRLVGGDR